MYSVLFSLPPFKQHFGIIPDTSKGQLSEDDVLVLEMDVVDFNSHQRLFQHAVNHFGRIDILVNNAGRSQRATWENIELAVDKELFDLNVFGVINLSKIAIDHFKKNGQGHIAVVSSLAGVMPVPFSGTYSASKYATYVSIFYIFI